MSRAVRLAVIGVALAGSFGFAGVGAPRSAATAAEPAVRFTDITRPAGIDFTHVNGASPDKHLVETMGSGGLFFDYDDDGWLDIFLVDGGSLADAAVARRARHRLYRNRGGGTFEDRTAQSGIQHPDYGMGACAGDYDTDGRIDLYVTNHGPNVLYRNLGDRFEDVTGAAGVGLRSWSASCAFADLDRDGDLDLFVTGYVEATVGNNRFCGNAKTRTRFYCHPLNFRPLSNTLYRNDRGRRFVDVSAEAGIAGHRGNSLGVVIGDYDDNGTPDVFVANDSVPNFLFDNRGDLRFVESGLGAGVAVATDGKPRAGMGTDAADYDGDGRLDLVVTNLDFETHSLFRNLGEGLFFHATVESGLAFATLPFVGFGALFLDVDHDTRLDLAIANGHIMDNAPQFRPGTVHAQRKLLFRNTTGRRFAEIGRLAGAGFALEKVGRGLMSGDIDNDGDLDLLVTNNGQSADLLRNDSDARGRALIVRVVGAMAESDVIGARLRLTVGARTFVRETKAGSSYLGQSDPRAHFGFDARQADRLEVRWPSGRVEVLRNIEADQIITVREGQGIVRRTPFTKPVGP